MTYTPYSQHAPSASATEDWMRDLMRKTSGDAGTRSDRALKEVLNRPLHRQVKDGKTAIPALSRSARQTRASQAMRDGLARAFGGRRKAALAALSQGDVIWRLLLEGGTVPFPLPYQTNNPALAEGGLRQHADFTNVNNISIGPGGRWYYGNVGGPEPPLTAPTTAYNLPKTSPPSALPDQGWTPDQQDTIAAGGWGFDTFEVRRRDFGSTLHRYTRRGQWFQNPTAEDLPFKVDVVPEVALLPAVDPQKMSQRQVKREIRLVNATTVAVSLKTAPNGAVSVKVTLEPDPRPPGGFGTNRLGSRTKRERKLFGSDDGLRAGLRAAASALENLDDIRDWWNILMDALGLSDMSFFDQVTAMQDPRAWLAMDWEGLALGFADWYADEIFHGRALGRVDDLLARRLGYGSRWGVGNALRPTGTDNPLTEIMEWLFQ